MVEPETMSNERPSFKDMKNKWEKKTTMDRTGAAPFKPEPTKQKSKLIKSNEDAIKAYRTGFADKNFAQKAPTRGMSLYNRPVQLKNVFGAKLESLLESKPPVFEKSDSDAVTIRKSISDNIFFNDLTDSEQKVFIDAFEPVTKSKDFNITNQGEEGDFFYVLAEGQVTFLIDDEIVGTAESCSCFGDLALLYTCPRAATVRAESDPTKLFRVEQNTFRSLLQKQTKIIETEKLRLLRSVDFLNDIDSTDLKRLSAAMSARSINPGDTLVKKGTAGNVFYLVAEGELDITDISVGSISFDDVKLKKGDYFGERALATLEPRAANITATKAGFVFSIDRKTFDTVLGDYSRLIMRAQDKNIMEGIDLLKMANLNTKEFEELADLIVDKEFKTDEMIFSSEEETEAALYILRQGSVCISGEGKGQDDIIKPGGYFGESLLLLDSRGPSERRSKTIPRTYARAGAPSFCGVLYLHECRQVFDTSSIPDLHGENKHYPGDVEANNDEEMFMASPAPLNRETTRQWLRKASSDLLRTAVKTNVMLDDLQRHSILGEGQFGEVWLVSAQIPGNHGTQSFALKIQQKSDESRGDSVDVIKREIDVLRLMDHPFVITYVHQYEDAEHMYILMRLVHGGELFDLIHYENDDGTWSSGIPEEDAKFYTLIIADTLEYMHRKQFIFRDLKPENVLIDKDGYPVICDFGFAKFVEDLTYTMCGTPNYLSPEVILNKGHGFATDHWSLGVLVYEMVVGENPFYYDDMPQMELFEAIVRDKFYPLPDEVSDDVFDVIDGLLIKDPTRRLGALAGRGKDIINIGWFRDLDLVDCRQKRHEAPFIPKNTELEKTIRESISSLAPTTYARASEGVPGTIPEVASPLSAHSFVGNQRESCFGSSTISSRGLLDDDDDDD